MPEDKNRLISLREAAELSGYSADYVGQLIRAGKIPGKQVYCNIAWMTTAEAILDYKQSAKAKTRNPGYKLLGRYKQRLAMELNTLKLFWDNFRTAWSLFVFALVVLLLFNVCILYFFFAPHQQPVNAGGGGGEVTVSPPVTY